MKKYLLLLLPIVFIIVACDESDDDPVGDELARLDAWIKVNNITVQPTASGLYYINKQEGMGFHPADSDYVLISSVVRNLDDYVYQTTIKDSAKLYDLYSATTHYTPTFMQYFTKVSKMKGLAEGLGMMREGGKARLIIPSTIGYGKRGNGSVTSSTTLIYDVELVKVIPDPEEYELSLINDYISKHPGFVSISDSIYMMKVDDDEGTTPIRDCIIAKDTVVHAKYVGKFLDGFVFDTNIEKVARENGIYSSSTAYVATAFTVGSSNLTVGFSTALKHMVEGEKAIVIVPSKFAYGVNGKSSSTTSIQAYEPLIFEITVVEVSPKDS